MPASAPEKVAKAARLGADEVVVDLEDAVVSAAKEDARRAPRLGEHTEQIFADLLGLGATEIGRLHDDGVVASASPRR